MPDEIIITEEHLNLNRNSSVIFVVGFIKCVTGLVHRPFFRMPGDLFGKIKEPINKICFRRDRRMGIGYYFRLILWVFSARVPSNEPGRWPLGSKWISASSSEMNLSMPKVVIHSDPALLNLPTQRSMEQG